MSTNTPDRAPMPYLLPKGIALRVYAKTEGSHFAKLKAVQRAVLAQHGIVNPFPTTNAKERVE